MENKTYMQEGLDLKRIILRFVDKIWMVIAAILGGAILGAGIYLIAHLIFDSQKEYQSISKVYLNFDCDPADFNELSYNGYTWNDLMITNPILDYTMEGLSTDISRDMVIAATKAEILSDIRLLTITITTPQPDLTAQIMTSTQESLVHLGEVDELFDSIEIYSTTEPQQIIWDNRIVNAAITGALIVCFLLVVGMVFYYIMDDSIYVQADAEKKFGLPVFGIFTDEEVGSFQSYGSEFLANYKYLCKGLGKISLMSVDRAGDADKAKQMMERVISMSSTSDDCLNIPMAMPQDAPDVYEGIRKTDGTILIIRYGSGNGKLVERAISNLIKQNCKILGTIIIAADVKFLKRYYMGKTKK